MSSDKQVSFDSNFAYDKFSIPSDGTSGPAADARPLQSEAHDEFKKILIKREKLIVTQGDFIGEAVTSFGKLDSLNPDGKLERDELVKAAASSDKKTAKLATILLNNTELIAADGQSITLKDLASLQTQKAGMAQERRLLSGISGLDLDRLYNAANTNKADDLTLVEVNARMQAGKMSTDERSKVSYILSNFEIIDKATGNDGALSEQDIRVFAAGRSARILDVHGLDNKFDTTSKKVWYESRTVRVPSAQTVTARAWPGDAATTNPPAIGEPVGAEGVLTTDGGPMLEGRIGIAAEGSAKAKPARVHHH